MDKLGNLFLLRLRHHQNLLFRSKLIQFCFIRFNFVLNYFHLITFDAHFINFPFFRCEYLIKIIYNILSKNFFPINYLKFNFFVNFLLKKYINFLIKILKKNNSSLIKISFLVKIFYLSFIFLKN
jgi:hypothetical protein